MMGIIRIRRLCSFFAAALLVSISLAQTEDPTNAIALALQNREFEKALALLRPALEHSPNDPRLWAMQGTAYARQNDKAQALTAFRHAMQLAPEYLPALQGAAQIEYEASSPAAVPLLNRLLRLRPQDLTTHGMLAILQYQQGNCNLAVAHFEKAEQIFNSQIDALNAYATCLVRVRQFDRAIEIFQRGVALNPEDARERQVLASVQLMAHHPQDAIATLVPLMQSSPNSETLELAATAHEDLHNTPQAVDLLRQAILLNPQNVNLYVAFALISAAHQSGRVGINLVSDGIVQNPNAAQLYLTRGVLYAQLDEYEKAEADFEKSNELDPNQSLSVAAKGLAAMQKNDLDAALASVESRLARKPNDPSLLYLRGDILAQKGVGPESPEFAKALSSTRKAVALQPGLGPAHAVLAKLYLRNGQYKAAIEQCQQALKIDPKDQTALYRLIQALQKDGKAKETPELLKKLAALKEQTTKEDRERYRYRLADDSTPAISSKP